MKPHGCTIAGIPVMLPTSKVSGSGVAAGLDAALEGAGFDGGTAMTSHTSNAQRISSINTVRSRSALMKSTAE